MAASSNSQADFPQLLQRVERLEFDVKSLKEQVATLIARSHVKRLAPVPPVTPEQLRRAVELAEQVGFRVLKTEVETDPGEPDYPFWVIDVEGSGTSRELIHRQLKWHALLDCRTERDPHPIRLFVIPIS